MSKKETKKTKERVIGPLIQEEQEQDEEDYAFSRPSVSHIKSKDKNTYPPLRFYADSFYGASWTENWRKGRMRSQGKEERKERGKEKSWVTMFVSLYAKTDLKAPPAKQPRTLDNTREKDDTMVTPDDEEVRIFHSSCSPPRFLKMRPWMSLPSTFPLTRLQKFT